MKPALAPVRDPVRNAELALIHTAKRDRRMTDDDYRATVRRISNGRTESSGALTGLERKALIEHFRKLGFTAVKKGAAAVDGADRRADVAGERRPSAHEDHRPQAQKIWVLWRSLYELGAVRDPGDRAREAFIQRLTGVAVIRWNDSDSLNKVIDALTAWCRRLGFDPKPYAAPPTAPHAPQAGSFKPALIEAQWQRLIALGAFKFGIFAGLDTWMAREGWPVTTPGFLTDDQAERAIRKLGAWIRRIAPPPASEEPAHSPEGPDG